MRRAALAFCALLLAAGPARAWDDEGHMIVAAKAYDALTTRAKARLAVLLPLNPDYAHWIAGVAPAQQARAAFTRASTWPDLIKGRIAGYANDGDQPPPDPSASQNIGYPDHLQHRYWHFIDRPFSPDGTPVVPPPTPNADTQIRAFTAALSTPGLSDDIRSYDIVWLLHLVGDVHQPLHCTSRFDRQQPEGDQGGNKVAITCTACPAELHFFWDMVLGTDDGLAPARKLARALPPVDPHEAAAAEPVWIDESFQLARTVVYAAPVGVGAGPYPLDAAYEAKAHEVALAQVALAAARLARLLNAALH